MSPLRKSRLTPSPIYKADQRGSAHASHVSAVPSSTVFGVFGHLGLHADKKKLCIFATSIATDKFSLNNILFHIHVKHRQTSLHIYMYSGACSQIDINPFNPIYLTRNLPFSQSDQSIQTTYCSLAHYDSALGTDMHDMALVPYIAYSALELVCV